MLLSDDMIENLIQPILDRQEAINVYVIKQIAAQIKRIGQLNPSSLHKLERLYKTGSDVQKINAEIARLTGLQVRDIKNLIRDVALNGYIYAKPYFDYRKKPFIPFEKNKEIQRVVNAITRQTLDTYKNLSKAQAFMLRDMANPKKLIPTPMAEAYQTVVDEAIQTVQSGVIDYNTAMRRTLDQLSQSGLRVVYQTEKGKFHTQRMDTAVRRNLLDGVRAINQGVQDEVGKEFGADGKEITVHRFSAPDHEPIQGHQFTNEEFEKLQTEQNFEDYQGRKFGAIRRPIGALNCRHFTYSIVLETSKPMYTDEQLEKFKEENAKGFTPKGGKHLTMYQCTQHQRQLETQIRYAKEGKIAADAAGDKAESDKYLAKVSNLMKEYQAFSKSCGLSPKLDKIRVKGYTDK